MPSTLPASGPIAPGCWALDYWFRRCQGFEVWDTTHPIGYVEAVLTSDDDEPHSLVVRVGSTFSVLLTFAVEAVEGVDPMSERVFVAPSEPAEQATRQLRLPGVT